MLHAASKDKEEVDVRQNDMRVFDKANAGRGHQSLPEPLPLPADLADRQAHAFCLLYVLDEKRLNLKGHAL